ncbi:hypothetical protein IPL68_02485 [Candidatus Saccharibacteria bacterium]|nr:MAG: hypothetical protein IPL68_02485 [Candidatus Saccharibacteria bacterium]
MNEKQTNQVKPLSVTELSQVKPVRPTKKQKELLGFIEQFIAEHGYSPSYREIMSGLHYNSVATVALHVGNLIKRGHLVKRDHSARSLEVVNPSGQVAAPFLTNEIKEAEEKWLVTKVEKLFVDAESTAVSVQQLDDIAIVLAALRVLDQRVRYGNSRCGSIPCGLRPRHNML